MRYLIPMYIAAILLTGCATSRPAPEASQNQQDAVTSDRISLLEDIPLIGQLFEPKTVSASDTDAHSKLKDIPKPGDSDDE